MNQVQNWAAGNGPEVSRAKRLFLIPILLFGVGVACNLPESITRQGEESGENVRTSVAKTVAARPSGTPQVTTDTPNPGTNKSENEPRKSPTMTITSTLTPTKETARVHVSGDTFCRVGPGSVYDQRGIFNTGEEEKVHARDPSEGFWYVTNPDTPAEKCWIWGKYATPQGPTAGLPVFTPPPTPTPGVTFSFDYLRDDCGAGGCYLWFVVENTGSVPLESMTGTVNTMDGSGTVISSGSSTSNTFFGTKFDTTSDVSKADPGVTVYTWVGRLPNPLGSTGVASMTLCSDDDLNGTCVTRKKNISP